MAALKSKWINRPRYPSFQQSHGLIGDFIWFFIINVSNSKQNWRRLKNGASLYNSAYPFVRLFFLSVLTGPLYFRPELQA